MTKTPKIAYAVKMTDSRYYTVYQSSMEEVATDVRNRIGSPNPLGAEGSKIRGSKVRLQWVAKCTVLRDGDHPKTSRLEDLSETEQSELNRLVGGL